MKTRSALLLLLVMPMMSLSMHLSPKEEKDTYPSDIFKDDDRNLERTEEELTLSFSKPNEENEGGSEKKREDELEKLKKIFGIRGKGDKSVHHKVPPQFMMELYNTIADDSGVTRGRNPYNAKVVRSFIEKGKLFSPTHTTDPSQMLLDTSLSNFYFFNVSGLEVNESVLEAELHLYRKKITVKTDPPPILTSSYYLLRVYQVLDKRSLAEPSRHKLVNIHYVEAHSFGWQATPQVLNVKEAVLSWVNNDPNLGLLVTVTTLFDDEVDVEFSRRSEYRHNKQPILVLFNDDGKEERRPGMKIVPEYYTYGNNDDIDFGGEEDKIDVEEEKTKGHEDPLLAKRHETETFRRNKRKHEGSESIWREDSVERDRRDTNYIRKCPKKIVSHRTKRKQVLTSMEIYERAMLREKLIQVSEKGNRNKLGERRLTKRQSPTWRHRNTTACSRYELYVDFKEIGLSSSIIAPKGYSAYHCKGLCQSPLSQEQQPTNHATVQGIVQSLGLVDGVEMPCCVPTKLLSTTILFYDDNENVILKTYEDMVADRCGCH
ncbi:hypothetical protein M0802_012464 [Mischocyttarus mexicanus]|nr:hypothetical protein M0802_012464 [Mischocyttarus mexicanus]